MSGAWWSELWDAFTGGGLYESPYRQKFLDEVREHRETLADARQYADRALLVDKLEDENPGGGTDQEKATRFVVALIRLHHHVYGTWPPAERIQQALDALQVPNTGALRGEET